MHDPGHIFPAQRIGDDGWLGQLPDHTADVRIWMRGAVDHGDRVATAGECGNGCATDEAGAPGDHDPAGAGW
jgi:hypothetical protein